MTAGNPAEARATPTRTIYSQPPVIELIIGIGVTLPRKFKVGALQRAIHGPNEGFPTQQAAALVQLQAQGSADAPAQASVKTQENGFRWIDPEGGRVLAMEATRYSYSKLPPYSNWETVRDEARRYWGRYVELARPVAVSHIGLRYINRINIALPSGQLGEYFLTRLEVADGVPSTVANWTFEIGIPQPDLADTMVVVRQARVEPPRPDVASIIFDIDVVKAVQFAGRYEAIWGQLETLHTRANLYFERSITQKTRDLFD